MKTTNKFLLSGVIGMATIGAALVAPSVSVAEDSETEKCYGVAKAGANDCGSKIGGHSCAGQATEDAAEHEFIAVPAGLCERLAGGSLTEAAAEDHGDDHGDNS